MSSDPAATLRHRTNAMPAPPGTGQAEDIRQAAEQIASKIPPHHTLTSLSITHVQFAQDDLLSKLFAYVTLSPLAILCGYVAVIITSRDLKPAVMLAGQLANELVNLILKRLVKQARPTGIVTLPRINCMPRSLDTFFNYKTTWSTSNADLFDITLLSLYLVLQEYLGDGYGMPSSHSQFMAYFATYVVILMYRR